MNAKTIMKKLLCLLLFLNASLSRAQLIEADLFQKDATPTTARIGVRIRATGANVPYVGLSFGILYQSANAAPQSTTLNSVIGVDDSKLVTQFGWGTGSRYTNPQQVVAIDPGAPGGITYDRRYVYGNGSETGGTTIQIATPAWDTLLYITFNTLQPFYPQGGYAYLQSTAEEVAVVFIDPSLAPFPYLVNSGDRPLGLISLPVTFTRFDARCNGNGTLLTWTTAQESNSRNFEIQKSNDGTAWENVAVVPAAGNSASQRNYQQLDLSGGAAFYRIKQVDNDGRFVYTSIVRTHCEVSNSSSVIYPVPTRDVLNLVINYDRVARTQLMVYETSGKLVRKIDATILKGNNTFKINIAGLAAGDYLLKSSNPEIVLNKLFRIVN
jgi:hypothetical protein